MIFLRFLSCCKYCVMMVCVSVEYIVWLNYTQMYWVGPLVAGVVAGLLYDLLFAANVSLDKTKAFFTTKDYDDSQFGEAQKPPAKTAATASA